jgi:hypothetical protein
MAQKSKNPPAGGARRARKCDRLAAYHASEHNSAFSSIQSLRVAHLARRFALPQALAAAVASLVYGEVRG